MKTNGYTGAWRMNDLGRLIMYYGGGRLFVPRPRYLCFNATLRCDGRCLHCGIWEEKKPARELRAAELGETLKRPFFKKIETAWLTGGEPTLREDIGEVSEVMVGSLPSLSTLGIATNGLAPDRVLDRVAAMAESVKGSGCSLFIHVSLDGVGKVHDRVRQKRGAFDAVAETIDRISELRTASQDPAVELGLNCVVQPENISNLEEVYRFSRERSLPLLFNVAMITDQIYRSKARGPDLKLDEKAQQELLKFLERIMPEVPAPLRYQYRNLQAVLSGGDRPYRCLTLYSTVNINADGTWIPCPATSDLFPRDVTEEEMDKLWKSREVREFRRKVSREVCPDCMLSCSLGDSMPLSEWLGGGWDGRAGLLRKLLIRKWGGGPDA